MGIVDQAIDFLSRIGAEILAVTRAIEHSLGFSNDTLYLIAGVALHLLAAFILRSSLRNFGPWLLVLALALVNELNDFHVQVWPDRLGHGAKDIVLIMLVPTILLIVARKKPNLLTKRS